MLQLKGLLGNKTTQIAPIVVATLLLRICTGNIGVNGGGAENKIFSEKETGFGRPIFDAKCSPFNVDARVWALVYWLYEETHVPKAVGLNPSTIYWMDIFQIYLL